ncbi:MAG: type II toxin-antitoxin system RelE/ParE family toxin [Gammaproteobacteria bacterium]|nr:type II toxin-antitoxin system RelE/ParE family toxin [Gammaproteobacteria bacterium]MDE1888360.1 type II toxin-antitoxin system RelE/ParE family toxin [Gammaproteobacteria bacterium]MDE2024639.1 type II toxin-antitoxin system RelE/ParE family toxin [Gammaproteobacteria bacterium]
MTLPVRFHRSARAEFIDAAAWYESKRQGLGDEFIAEIERCVTLIAAQPQLYAEVHNRIRRLTTRRFPYSIYFRPETQRIVVLAVFHGSRDPMIWQRRG